MKYIKRYEAAPKDDGEFKFKIGDYVAYRNIEHNRKYNYSEMNKAWLVVNTFYKNVRRFITIKKNAYDLESEDTLLSGADEYLLRKMSSKEIEQYKLEQSGRKYNL